VVSADALPLALSATWLIVEAQAAWANEVSNATKIRENAKRTGLSF
jgi:phage FluMu gp28-like protein